MFTKFRKLFVRFEILEMSSANSRLKTASGARPLSSIGTEKTKTSHGTRKPKNQSAPVEKLRNLTKTNQEIAMKISNLESDRDKLLERIQALQDHLIQDQDLISGLKSQLSQLTKGTSNLTTANNISYHDDETTDTVKSDLISPANCISFLQNRPMILTYFLGFDDDFIKFNNSIDSETQSIFISKSAQQLNRFFSCFSLFQILTQKVQSFEFMEICKEKMKEMFDSISIIIIIKEPKTTKFQCLFDDKEMLYEINEKTSMISASLNSQEVVMQNQNRLSESLRVDVILNPNCHPTIILPFGQESAILFISQKVGDDKNFSPEDQIVSIFLSELLRPLFDEHLRFLNLMKEAELRRSISSFQREVISKKNLQLLLPYLFEVIANFTAANDVNLFIVGDNSFYSFEVENEEMKKKNYPFTGIPKMIIETKKKYITEKMSQQDNHCFDPVIDMWGLNKCFAAFPIFMNNKEAIAVLAMIDKNQSNSFNQYEIEFLEAITISLGIVLLKCIESSGESPQNLPIVNLKKLTETVSSLNKEMVNNGNESISQMAKGIHNIFNCEWLTIYSKNQRNLVKRLLTLHNGEKIEKSVLLDESSNAIFNRENLIAETDEAKISALFKLIITVNHSLLFSHDDKIAIFCFNCCSADEIHKSIMNSCLTAISYSIEIESTKQEITDNRNCGVSLRNVFDITTTAMQNENPFLSLLTMVCDLISMTTFCLFRHEKSKDSYSIFMHGKDVKEGNIEFSDPFMNYASNVQEKPSLIDKFTSSPYCSSSITNFFPFFTHVIVFPIDFPSVFLVFAGESVTINYESLLQYFAPIIICLYKNHKLQNEPVKETHVTRHNEYLNLNLVDAEISARLFSVKKFNEVHLVGIVVKMFENLDLLTSMKIVEPSDFLTAILSIREAYLENPNPFHNWHHAIDTTQFIYSCLLRGRMRRYFRPIQIAALLMASLCHDIGHKGLNTTFHLKAKTSIFYTFGEQSPLERYHATRAIQILQNSPIYEGIDNPTFWNFFVNSIVATDMVRHFEFIENFKAIYNRFEFGNELHQLTLAQFLIKCGKYYKNFRRRFSIRSRFA